MRLAEWKKMLAIETFLNEVIQLVDNDLFIENDNKIRNGILLLAISNDIKFMEQLNLRKILVNARNLYSGCSIFTGYAQLGLIILNLKQSQISIKQKDELIKQINRILEDYIDDIYLDINKFEYLELINGLVGVGRYLLNFSDIETQSYVKKILKIIYNLCFQRKILYRKNNNLKYYDLGMSHGISGVLAFISICNIHGVDIKQSNMMILHLYKFIDSYKYNYRETYLWPCKINLNNKNITLSL